VLASQRWKVGDTVTLSSPSYDVTLEFKIVGAIDDPANGNFWFQRPYLEETLRARGSEMTGIGTVWVRVADKGRVIPVMREIEAALAGGEVPVATETERDFNAGLYGGLQGIIGMTLFVTFIVSLAIVFIGANTASMTVRERAPEIAVLRALGFPRRTLFVLLIAESTLLAACAGTLGVALALGVTALLRSGMDEAGGLVAMLQSFQVGPSIAALGLLLASAVGVLSALLPAYGAARRNVVTTLREVF
jgi:putative ABC transport system permease protein